MKNPLHPYKNEASNAKLCRKSSVCLKSSIYKPFSELLKGTEEMLIKEI